MKNIRDNINFLTRKEGKGKRTHTGLWEKFRGIPVLAGKLLGSEKNT
jgi:hypothetical protein